MVKNDGKPEANVSNAAFDLWALLRATSARLHQMENDGPIGDEEVAELNRLISSAADAAEKIGVATLDS